MRARWFALAAALAAGFSSFAAWASCPDAIAWQRPRPMLASLANNEAGEVGVTFLGHASFLIESPGGVTAVTDFNGYNVPRSVPDIVTMNNQHSTHYTDRVPPGVKHALHGWSTGTAPPVHDLRYRDMRVRNIATNTRDWSGDTRTRVFGNSIFIFEAGDVCIAHLSHLHHLLEPSDLAELGLIDVLMVSVDGAWTISQDDMLTVIDQVKPKLVMPMHYFSQHTLGAFLTKARERYPVRAHGSPRIVLTRAMLPRTTEVLVMAGF